MNIYTKYKSHFIAAFSSLIIYTLFFLFLFIKPGDDNSTVNTDMDLAIQFKLLDEIPLPTPSQTEKTSEENIKESQPKATPTIVENFEKETENSGETVQSASNDSVLIAEIKKALEEIKGSMPEDSLPKESIQPNIIEKSQQNLADKSKNYYEERQFYYNNYRTIMNIKMLYPYVLKARQAIDNLNVQLASVSDRQEKRRLIKKTEKDLFNQYEKDVRKMSYSQGKLLLKLLARETNQSAYGLIKTYRGGFPATFWYSVGLIFHEDLKARYDSVGEDALLEKIVQKYKKGNF